MELFSAISLIFCPVTIPSFVFYIYIYHMHSHFFFIPLVLLHYCVLFTLHLCSYALAKPKLSAWLSWVLGSGVCHSNEHGFPPFCYIVTLRLMLVSGACSSHFPASEANNYYLLGEWMICLQIKQGIGFLWVLISRSFRMQVGKQCILSENRWCLCASTHVLTGVHVYSMLPILSCIVYFIVCTSVSMYASTPLRMYCEEDVV